MVVPLAVAFLGTGFPFIGIGFPGLALNAGTPTARPAAFAAAYGIPVSNPGGDRCPYPAARPPLAAAPSRYAAAFPPDPGRPRYAGTANFCAAGRGYPRADPANHSGNPAGNPAAIAAACNADLAGRRAIPNAADPAHAPAGCSHRNPHSGSAAHANAAAHAYTATYRRHCPAPRGGYRCRWPPISAADPGTIRGKQLGGRRAGLSGL